MSGKFHEIKCRVMRGKRAGHSHRVQHSETSRRGRSEFNRLRAEVLIPPHLTGTYKACAFSANTTNPNCLSIDRIVLASTIAQGLPISAFIERVGSLLQAVRA